MNFFSQKISGNNRINELCHCGFSICLILCGFSLCDHSPLKMTTFSLFDCDTVYSKIGGFIRVWVIPLIWNANFLLEKASLWYPNLGIDRDHCHASKYNLHVLYWIVQVRLERVPSLLVPAHRSLCINKFSQKHSKQQTYIRVMNMCALLTTTTAINEHEIGNN